MTSPRTIPAGLLQADARSERLWTPLRPLSVLRSPTAERTARSCLVLFLAAALRPGAAGSNSLAAALFAHGAVEAVARRAALGRRASARLERILLRTIGGPGRRASAGWRRTLCEHGATAHGQVLRRCGEEALGAWLRGEAPARRLEAALRTRPPA